MFDIVIYHANCMDGFCAAWLLYSMSPNAKYVPMNYGELLTEDVQDKNVIIVDFSFKRPILESLKQKAKTLIVLDHHKTAEADLAGLDYCKFDLSKSGAQLTYDWMVGQGFNVHPYIKDFVDYIADRDLWHWKLQNSKEINAALGSYPMTFEMWGTLAITKTFGEFSVEGHAILRYQKQQVIRLLENKTPNTIADHKVFCVNTATLISEIGHELAKLCPFGVTYFINKENKYIYSFRSVGDFDVSKIASIFGGGGHKNAAGCVSATPIHKVQ